MVPSSTCWASVENAIRAGSKFTARAIFLE
jgi:hypothetical protein